MYDCNNWDCPYNNDGGFNDNCANCPYFDEALNFIREDEERRKALKED